MGTTIISSVRLCGTKHTICEDSTMFRRKNGWHIAVLSDGAGSAKKSAIGSSIVVKTVSNNIISILKKAKYSQNDLFNGNFAIRLSKLVIEKICQKLQLLNDKSIKDFASTLLVSIYNEKFDRWIVMHIGDGVIGAMDTKGELHSISKPLNGEFANETFFVTDKNAYKYMRIYLLKGVIGVVMMSDGTATTFYAKKTDKLANGIKTLFDWQKKIGEKKMETVIRNNIKAFTQKKTDDDCSMILIQLNTTKYKNFSKITLKG
jgi:serine/threonine protein phosphatase PrpC